MKALSDDERALKELVENSEKVYRNFQTSFRTEIPKAPKSPSDSRMHRIEVLWHQMRKEVDQLQTSLVRSEVEGSEEEALKTTFRNWTERG